MDFSVRKKAIIGIVVAVVLVVGVGLGIGFHLNTKEKFVDHFKELVEDKKTAELQKEFVFDTSEKKVTKEEVSAFYNYLKLKEENKETFFNDLEKQAEQKGTEKHAGTFQIVSTGRKALFFPKYQLKVTPHYVTVSTDADRVIIKENKKALNYDKQKKRYGPVFPGVYNYNIELDSTLPTINATIENVVVWDKDKNIEAHLAKSAETDKEFTEKLASVIDLFSDEYAAFMGGGFEDAETPVLKDLASEFYEIRPLISELYYKYNGIVVNNDSIKLNKKGQKWTLKVMVFLDTENYLMSPFLNQKMDIEESEVYEYQLEFDKKWQVVQRDTGFGKVSEWKNKEEVSPAKPKVYSWNSESDGGEKVDAVKNI